MRLLIEACLHVAFDDPCKLSLHELLTPKDRVMRTSIGPKPIGNYAFSRRTWATTEK